MRHEVLQKGQADASVVFTTDGQIKADKEVILKDDKNIFPPYNVTLVVDDKALQKARAGLREDDRAGPEGHDHAGACRSSTRASTSTSRSRRPSPPST